MRRKAACLACFGNRAVGQIVAAANDACAGNLDQTHGFGFARFKTHRRPGRNIQPLAVGLGAVEFQGRIGLDEMIVAADLHWAVAQDSSRRE